MTTDAQVLPNRLLPVPTLYQQAIVTGLLAGWADWLFFGHGIGVGFTIFIIGLAAAIVLVKRSSGRRIRLVQASVVLFLAVLPAIETVNLLSMLFAGAGIVTFLLIVHDKLRKCITDLFEDIGGFLVRIPVRLPTDVNKFIKVRKRLVADASERLGMSVWIVPAAFSLVFLALFASANPLIEKWLHDIDLSALTDHINGTRTVFWIIALLMCWPFMRFKPLRRIVGLPVSKPIRESTPDTKGHVLFSEPAVFRSLMMFNVLFGLQIGLDATYLLGGADLPDGMTYAEYAHRGAYPLICTALLAAGFVLFATRPGSSSENSGRVRSLILAWTLQNVVLVAFSIQRLDLYVDTYAMTYWRFAAFVWMALVFIGLVLIVAKFAKGRSNAWLVEANLISLVSVLYIVSFVNVSSVVADFNVTKSVQDGKQVVDGAYLGHLGPYAIPAIDRALANRKSSWLPPKSRRRNLDWLSTTWSGRLTTTAQLKFARERMAAKFAADHQHWRSWSFRGHRLQRYLDSITLSRVPNGNQYNAR